MSQPTKTKELKIITRKVVTLEDVKKNKRMLKLLHIIDHLKEISEPGLIHLLYEMKNAGVDLGYNFIVVANKPGSKEVHQDLLDLLYLNLVEKDPVRGKLRITSTGKEFLEKNGLPEEEVKPLLAAVDQAFPKIKFIEEATGVRRGRRI